jgi:hypothetical protein
MHSTEQRECPDGLAKESGFIDRKGPKEGTKRKRFYLAEEVS